MSEVTKKPAQKKVLKLKKNYAEFGKKGDPVTKEMEQKAKDKGISIKAIAE